MPTHSEALREAHALLPRPVLEAIPAFKAFYDQADGFWQKAWALCGKSVTVMWCYALAAVGFVMQWIEPLATALGDPDIKQQVTETLQANPKVLGHVLMGISAVTAAAHREGG
jgi:hypothetical protein